MAKELARESLYFYAYIDIYVYFLPPALRLAHSTGVHLSVRCNMQHDVTLPPIRAVVVTLTLIVSGAAVGFVENATDAARGAYSR